MKPVQLTRQQRILLDCAPINEERVEDKAMKAVIARARGTPEFVNQQDFDRAINELVGTIPIPNDVAEWFSRDDLVPRQKWSWKRMARNPAFAAIGIALLVIAGVFASQFAEHLHDFPGIGAAKKMLVVAGSTKSVLLDPMKVDAGTLSDLFFMKHNLEHYDVPPEFADFQTIGCRVFDDEEGRRVAQIWLVEKKMQLFLFPAERDPKTGAVREFSGWRNIEHEGWAGVVREQNGVCFMAALRGSIRQLTPYLAKPKE
jgi:hypothetical protein